MAINRAGNYVYGGAVIYDEKGNIISTGAVEDKKKKKPKQRALGMQQEFDKMKRAGVMLGGGAAPQPSMLGG